MMSYHDFGMIILAIILAHVILKGSVLIITTLFPSKSSMMGIMSPKPKMVELLTEIDMLIQIECVGLIDIPQNVKNIPLITDFRDVQKELVHNVLEALSSSFWRECNSSGLKRDYIITYVTRRANEEILRFIKKYNYDLTKIKPDFFAVIDREKNMRE